MTIVEFLEARLDEDEEVARDAAGWDSSGSIRDEGLWHRDGVNSVIDSARRRVVHGDGSAPDDSKATHIVRHDPARVLREVAAKRAIIEPHERNTYYKFDDDSTGSCAECSSYCNEDGCRNLVSWPCDPLRALASAYADHPDYQQEWAAE